MANPEHVEIVRQGKDAIAEWREENPTEELDLSGADLCMANLRKVDFSGAFYHGVYLCRVNLEGADLTKADLRGADLSNANLTGADLYLVKLNNAILRRAKLNDANLLGADLTAVDLNMANLLGVKINSSTVLQDISIVLGCKINRYSLEYLKSQSERLRVSEIMDMKIHDDIATLKSNFGSYWGVIHLTSIIIFLMPYLWFLVSNRPIAAFNINEIAVPDEVSKVAEKTNEVIKAAVPSKVKKAIEDSVASQNGTENKQQTITLLSALGRYIWSGGVGWDKECNFNFSPFLAFVFFLIYNLLRFTLLWKTKTLETQENVTGLPVQFSLNQKIIEHIPPAIRWLQVAVGWIRVLGDHILRIKTAWLRKIVWVLLLPYLLIYLLTFNQWETLLAMFNTGLFLYVFFVLYNSYHFLQMEITI